MEQQISQMLHSIEEIKAEIHLIRGILEEQDTEDVIRRLNQFIKQMEEDFETVKKEIDSHNKSIQRLKERQMSQQTFMHTNQPNTKRASYTIPSNNGAKLF